MAESGEILAEFLRCAAQLLPSSARFDFEGEFVAADADVIADGQGSGGSNTPALNFDAVGRP